MHLAATNPSCLKLLVEAATSCQLNQRDTFNCTALDYALQFSSKTCRHRSGLSKCSHCACAECAIALLEADCEVSWSWVRGALERTSERGRIEYIRHLRDRRERLKHLALKHLELFEIERFKLQGKGVLDRYAARVHELLTQRGVKVPGALFPGRRGMSVYDKIQVPHIASLFFAFGFCDVRFEDSRSYEASILMSGDLPVQPAYTHWLVNHGADIFRQLRPTPHLLVPRPPKCFTVAHRVFCSIGRHLQRHYGGDQCDEYCKPATLALHELVMSEELVDDCRCYCSSEGCTPLVCMLYGLVSCDQPSDSPCGISHVLCQYLSDFGDALHSTSYPAMIIRALTFAALKGKHTCCCCAEKQGTLDQEEIDEIREEEADKLELLEVLVEEFEAQFQVVSENASPNHLQFAQFFCDDWVPRMDAVVEELNKIQLSDDERHRAEDAGVIWQVDAPGQTRNPYPKSTFEHWEFELDQIVPEE